MGLKRLKIKLNTKSITLSELIVSIMIIGIMILSFYSLESFSHEKIVSADRRTKVQNSLSYCMDTMGKMVLRANGNKDNPPILLYPTVGVKSGFQVRVDFNTPQTPDNLADDEWVYFTISGNQLSVGGTTVPTEVLSSKILANFNNSVMPATPADGFYVWVDATGNTVDLGLVGRYDTASPANLSMNPQVAMKTRIFCNNSSAN
jgi:Tfp pilus assembly protein PilE